jgi:hypothetical protein
LVVNSDMGSTMVEKTVRAAREAIAPVRAVLHQKVWAE